MSRPRRLRRLASSGPLQYKFLGTRLIINDAEKAKISQLANEIHSNTDIRRWHSDLARNSVSGEARDTAEWGKGRRSCDHQWDPWWSRS